MKIRQVGAELSHADRQTDMTKLILAFYNFAKKPKDWRAESDILIKYLKYIPETE